ncbi:NADPH-dependent FMN reductase [Sediminibacterium soli]|uniref:NADPH-dependent FMN reductase n=1 Tax=Sediminibacterium soli TaxID=2698829 RepID=UPI00137A103B|nr:NAD(P)H-dependent oxidoreductase [Sediminibacterium soli]NCI45910.1 NAD(P)H-dependent oxidoreductase [Sediminibacterium soli]
MDTTIRLAGISGSLRKGSFNTLLLKETMQLLPADTTMDILPIADIPLYNADLDMPQAAGRPGAVTAFREAIAKADGLVIVSPEYNYGIPGGLKNAIDWASRGDDSPLLRKPIAVMGVTPGLWGTVRMQQAFQPLFTYLDMKPVYKPEVLLAGATQKFDAEGKLTDEKAKQLIRQKLENLRRLIVSGTY